MCNVTKKKIIFGLVFLSFLIFSQVSSAIEADDLANICEAMENAFVDISLEYEYFLDPPMTKDDIKGTDNWITVGPRKQGLIIKKPFTEHYLFTEKAILMNEEGRSYEGTKKTSYNGAVTKHFESGGLSLSSKLLREPLDGTISQSKRFMPGFLLTPLGFSVFRLSYQEETPLSEILRLKNQVQIDNSPIKINDFNSIRADIFAKWNKQLVVYKIYFSVDNGYTPIRYEFMKGSNIAGTVDVNSLQEVQKGLWFPSSGFNKSPGDRTYGFRATSKIIVNHGLKDEDFDIEFPPGTKIADEITGKLYTIRPTQEQVDKSSPQ